MGNSASAEEEAVDPNVVQAETDIDGTKNGYRILTVQKDSPAAVSGLVSYFDFIVGAAETRLDTEDNTFIDIIKEHEDKELDLVVYNIKQRQTRNVKFVPTRKWGGEGMLGITIKFDSYADSDEHVVHVLDVQENSPAKLAGIEPYNDYLLGTAHINLLDMDDLHDIINYNVDRDVGLYVYNISTDKVRRIKLIPQDKWGGEGLLGCNVGHGYLHRLPHGCRQTPGVTDLKSFDTTINESDDTATPTTPASSPLERQQSDLPLPPVLPHKTSQVLNTHRTPMGDGLILDSTTDEQGEVVKHTVLLDWQLDNTDVMVTGIFNAANVNKL